MPVRTSVSTIRLGLSSCLFAGSMSPWIMRVLEDGLGLEHMRPPRVLVDLVEAGHLGQKTGQGFYTVSAGAIVTAAPAPALGEEERSSRRPPVFRATRGAPGAIERDEAERYDRSAVRRDGRARADRGALPG